MAYRSLSRLSSALSAKASTLRSLQLDQMLFSKLRHIALCHLAGFVSLFYIDVTRYPRMSCYISFLQTFDTLRFLIQYSVFKVQTRNLRFRNGDGGIRTLDPLLARQVLSQLSYTPILSGTHLLSHAVSSIVSSAA